jgi:hypothetical protein
MIAIFAYVVHIQVGLITVPPHILQGGLFDFRKSQKYSSQKITKKEKSLSTRTVPTLQWEQFKYFISLSENLLRVGSYVELFRRNSERNNSDT